MTESISFTQRLQKFLNEKEKKLFIGGDWLESSSGNLIDVINPADKSCIARVPLANSSEVDLAVNAAFHAFHRSDWCGMPPAKREQLLNDLADKIEANADTLAQVVTLENGKLLPQAHSSDVKGAVSCFRYYAGWCTKIEGSTLDIAASNNKKSFAFTKAEPIGVVAAIIPWNFPLSIAAWKLAPALAAGCTVVLKPSEETPLSALILGELCEEVGFPPGVVNIITGDGAETGAALTNHQKVAKVTFTGSTETGKKIGKSAMNNLTGLSLELGGKNPVIVFDDADREEAVKGVALGGIRNQGQICVAGSRIYIQKKSYDNFMADLGAFMGKMNISHGFDPNAEVGPVVSQSHLNKINGYIEEGKKEGAELLTGGRRIDEKGYFVEPTLFSSVKDNLSIVSEEIFGPVLVGIPFTGIDDVLKRANDTQYGLSANIWSQNITGVHHLIDKLEAGFIFVNSPIRSDPNLPLGGFKQSGVGIELGKEGLYQYIRKKSVNIIY